MPALASKGTEKFITASSARTDSGSNPSILVSRA